MSNIQRSIANLSAQQQRLTPLMISAAFPYVPAILHLPHMASTYIPADICNRFNKILGRRCYLVSATDVHSIQVSQNGKDRHGSETLCAKHHHSYKKQFKRMNIEFDVYIRTDAPDHIERTQKTLQNLITKGLIEEQPCAVYFCDRCQSSVPKRMRIFSCDETKDAKCPWCKIGKVTARAMPHLHLNLQKNRQIIENFISGSAPPYARGWLMDILTRPLSPWCISRDNQVGIPLPHDTKRSLYLWFESLVGYHSLASMLEHNDLDFAHFIGKNILYSHGIIWPVLLRYGLNDAHTQVKFSARGFQNIKGSCTSFVDFDDSLQSWDMDFLRLYISATVPDGIKDFTFTTDTFKALIDKVVINKIGNMCRRLCLVLNGDNAEERAKNHVPDVIIKRVFDGYEQLVDDMAKLNTRTATKHVLDLCLNFGKYCEAHDIYRATTAKERSQAAYILAATLCFLAPLMPQQVNVFNPFQDWKPDTVDNIINAVDKSASYGGQIWHKTGLS